MIYGTKQKTERACDSRGVEADFEDDGREHRRADEHSAVRGSERAGAGAGAEPHLEHVHGLQLHGRNHEERRRRQHDRRHGVEDVRNNTEEKRILASSSDAFDDRETTPCPITSLLYYSTPSTTQ